MLFWNADKTTVEKSVFLKKVNELLEKINDKNIIRFTSREEINEFLKAY